MRGEDRLTEKKVAAQVLPKITEAREVLTSHLASLRYLWEKVDKKPADRMTMEGFALLKAKESLKRLEDELCRI